MPRLQQADKTVLGQISTQNLINCQATTQKEQTSKNKRQSSQRNCLNNHIYFNFMTFNNKLPKQLNIFAFTFDISQK